jgi:hypothetical protein
MSLVNAKRNSLTSDTVAESYRLKNTYTYCICIFVRHTALDYGCRFKLPFTLTFVYLDL